MAEDLVTRLRISFSTCDVTLADLLVRWQQERREAADEIERLRRRLGDEVKSWCDEIGCDHRDALEAHAERAEKVLCHLLLYPVGAPDHVIEEAIDVVYEAAQDG